VVIHQHILDEARRRDSDGRPGWASNTCSHRTGLYAVSGVMSIWALTLRQCTNGNNACASAHADFGNTLTLGLVGVAY
jgi:hypothetical protein